MPGSRRTIPLPGPVISGLWVLDGSVWVDALGTHGEALFRLDPRSGEVQASLPYVRADDVRREAEAIGEPAA